MASPCLPRTRGFTVDVVECEQGIRVSSPYAGVHRITVGHEGYLACLPRTRGFTGRRQTAIPERQVSPPYAGVHRIGLLS